MLDKEDASNRVSKILVDKAPPGQPWAVIEEHTMEIASAWIFFYNSRQYLETGNVIHALAGNGPVCVNKETGDVRFYGSTSPLEVIIGSYQTDLET